MEKFIGIRYAHIGTYNDMFSIVEFAAVLTIFNTVLKPIFKLIALPITGLTLGIFSLVINVLIVLLASTFVSGVMLNGFWASAGLAIIISILTTVFHIIFSDNN